jgi:glycosyltransferase involved in cell wall biosynthesis
MKIALIGTTSGCVIGFRSELIKDLVSHGHTVYAFALDYSDYSKMKVEEIGAIPVSYEFSRTGFNPFSDIVNTVKLSLLLKKLGADLVFSYFSKPVIFGTLAAVLAGIKRRVGMLEGLGYLFTDRPSGFCLKIYLLKYIQIFLYRCSFCFLERIIFLNRDDSIDLVKKYNLKVKKVSIVGGIGLNLDDYSYVEPQISPVTFIFIGRLLAEKGVKEFISAAKAIRKEYSDVSFVMLGGFDNDNPGSLRVSDLERVIDDETIIYPGHVEDVMSWLKNSSVFVLPSYREGVPRSTQEAMAIGRAVITTNVPGCRETVISGRNGFLVAPWSSNDLIEKMKIFIHSPSLIKKMGVESYRIAHEKFDAHNFNKAIINFFDQCEDDE